MQFANWIEANHSWYTCSGTWRWPVDPFCSLPDAAYGRKIVYMFPRKSQEKLFLDACNYRHFPCFHGDRVLQEYSDKLIEIKEAKGSQCDKKKISKWHLITWRETVNSQRSGTSLRFMWYSRKVKGSQLHILVGKWAMVCGRILF